MTIEVAVFGAGRIGKIHAANLAKQPGVRLKVEQASYAYAATDRSAPKFTLGSDPEFMVVSPDGAIREAPAAGPLLGAFEDSAWPEETVAIARGELLVLYTDGVTDTPGKDERFGGGGDEFFTNHRDKIHRDNMYVNRESVKNLLDGSRIKSPLL